jgi:hypothetical protein
VAGIVVVEEEGNVLLVEYCTINPVSLFELSVQLRLTCVGDEAAVIRFEGDAGIVGALFCVVIETELE